MSFCAIQNQDGSYQLTQVLDPSTCTGLLMQEGQDIAYWLRAFIDPDFLDTAQYQILFVSGFSLPMICYLVAWAYQSVINFATKDQ